MAKAVTTAESEIDATIARARNGDMTALALLEESCPPDARMWYKYGALGRHVEVRWLQRINGPEDHLSIKAMTAKLNELKSEMAGPNPSPLESVLVDRIGACWLAVCHAEMIVAQTSECTLAYGDYLQRRLDRSHARFLSAIKTLAFVRRLQLPAIQFNVAERQINVAG